MADFGDWFIADRGGERDLFYGTPKRECCVGTWDDEQLIQLRDLLNEAFPRDGWASPGAIAAVAEYASHRERREKIATAVLAGFAREETPHVHEAPHLVSIAVKLADLLIAKLDESEP